MALTWLVRIARSGHDLSAEKFVKDLKGVVDWMDFGAYGRE